MQVIVKGIRESLMEEVKRMQFDDPYKIFSYLERECLKVYEPFAHQYVATLLTLDVLRKWKEGGYIVESQTGTGKSTLVEDVIIPLGIERKKRVAIIVPREALAMQYKRDIAKKLCPEILQDLTESGLKKCDAFGEVDIFTYQSVVSYTKRKALLARSREYDFIIFDEVHAFVGDATFNRWSYEIFQFLVCEFGVYAKRVYLSATMEIVLREVVDMEQMVIEDISNPHWNAQFEPVNSVVNMYRFKADYQHLGIEFFQKEGEILRLLKGFNETKKTLIFVTSKSQGWRLKEALGQEAVFIDAESKTGDEQETYESLTEHQRFECRYLLATKWLDVGVNIKANEVSDVVCFQTYREEIVQMLGRKRLTNKGQRVNLYVFVPGYARCTGKLEELKKEYVQMQLEIQKHIKNGSAGFFGDLPHPIWGEVNNGKVELSWNPYALAINSHHQEHLQRFLDAKEDLYYDNYVKEVLAWFPGCSSWLWLDRDITALRKEVEELLDPLVTSGREFDKKEVMAVNDRLIELLRIPRRSDQQDSLAVSTINRVLKEQGIPYYIENLSKQGKKGVWRIAGGIK